MEELCFIVNPASRSGKSRRLIERLRAYLDRHLPRSALFFTEGPRHAMELARRAAESGHRRLIAVGGDGTFHEVANGILQLPKSQRPALGVIASGTGGDFSRRLRELYDFPRDFSWLKAARETAIDVGLVSMESPAGAAFQRYFINVASAGISGEVVRRVNASAKRFGTLEYFVATLRSVHGFHPPRARVMTEDPKGRREECEIELLFMVVANGRYFGGGMCIAPEAELQDGILDFIVADRVSYLTLLSQLPRVYRKKRFQHPKVKYREGHRLDLEVLAGESPLELDGEFFRVRKASFQVVAKALKILIPSPGPAPSPGPTLQD